MADPEPSSPVGFWRPFMIVSCVLPVYFLFGATVGQTAGMLPQLLEKHSFIQIDMAQSTWIASVTSIGMFVASCVSGWFADTFGQIRVMQASYFFFGVGYTMMVGANGFMLLVVGRFFAGIGTGCGMSALVYVSEISPPFWRGVFLSLNTFNSALGIIYMYAVGGYFPWNIAAGVALLISVVGLILTLFIYDSPVWLVQNNRIETARKSLIQIEGSQRVNARLTEIQELGSNQQKTKFNIEALIEPTVWKPFTMITTMAVLQNISGFYIVIYYTVLFFRHFHSSYDPLSVTIMVGLARLLSIGITSYLHGIIGRKPIGAISGFCCASMLILIFVYLKIEGPIPFLHNNSWIPIALFLLYIIMMSLGIYPLPWAMPFEVYPFKVRGVMCGVSCSVMFVAQFASLKSYNFLMDNLGIEGLIMMFAVGSFLFGVFSVTILVETHDKTLDEIEEFFAGRKQKETAERNMTLGQVTVSNTLPSVPITR